MAGTNRQAFQPMTRGEKLVVHHEEWNAFLQDHADLLKLLRAGSGETIRYARKADLCLVQNTTGNALNRFSILGIDSPLVPPATDEDEFAQRIAVAGTAPGGSSQGKFVVLQEPLPDGEIGLAVVAGVTPVQIYIQTGEENYGFADSKDGTTSSLVPVPVGSAQILWRESGTGLKWALVRVGNAQELEVAAGEAAEDIAAGDSGTVTLWTVAAGDFAATATTVTAYDFLSLGPLATGDRCILVKLKGQDEDRWLIVKPSGGSQIRWGVAQANWTYTGGVYPSQGGHARVTVQACDDSVGSNPSGVDVVVYLPNNASGDPNVVAGDVIAWTYAANGTPVCVSSYMDDPIGTVKMFTGSSSQVRPGWACMGGGNADKHLNGNSWDMEDKFARHSCSDGKVGTTGGADTHTHTGVTDYNETGIEVADHPDHRHDLTTTDYYDIQSGGATLIHSTSPAYTSGVKDTTYGNPLALTHTVTDEGHAHPFATGSSSNVPAHRYLRFIERVDNSA
jgi:hypothetical protein